MEPDNSRQQHILNQLTSVGHLGGGLGGLGLGAMSGLVEERVKVDRKRFEQMLGENSTIGCDADSFFRRVMKSTNTQIMWPPKLKPGTKSKKDPHVRITGSPNSINAAKEIIFEQLDTRRNRVTLKMDVAFTDHSHIIGKGGRSIQRVMDETGCHIHFPDSNRTNTAEKSNQVSIAGSAVGVEQSRCRIREMLPLTLQFDLPLNNGLHSPPTLDPQSPQLQAIQQTYGITITFRCDGSKCSNNSYFASSRIITVAVRGARSHLFGLQQGLSVLIEYLTGFRANTINVPLTMTIDVAIQHHSFIAGRSNCNLRSIMQSTGAVISMPDLNTSLATSPPPPQTPATSLTITSTGANIKSSTSDSLSNLMSSAGLNMSCNSDSSAALSALTAASSLSDINNPLTSLQHSSFMNALTDANNNSSSSKNNSHNNNHNHNHNNNDLNFHGSDSNLTTLGSSLSSSTSNLNSRKTAIVIRGQNFDSVYNAWQELLGYLPLILIFDLKEGQDLDPVQVTKLMEQMRQISILIKPKQRQNTKSIVVRGPERDSRLLFEVRRQILKLDDSEMQCQFDSQLLEKQQHMTPLIQDKSILKPQQQNPQQVLARHGQLQQQHQPEASVHQQQQQQQQQAQTQDQQQQQNAELQMKAIRAILEPNLQKARQPTPYWAGLGFSKSVSEPMIKEKLSVGPLFSSNLVDERRTSDANDNALHGLTSSLQSLQLNGQQKVSSCLKLAVFLGRIGLVQYLSLFTSRNIDLEMLFSLSEADYAELGLPYVHRRKLAIAIAEFKSLILNDQRGSSTFDAAPGAERSRRYKVGSANQDDLKDVWPM